MKKTFKVIYNIIFYILLVILGVLIGGVVIPIWYYKHHKKKILQKQSEKAQISSAETLNKIAQRIGVSNGD